MGYPKPIPLGHIAKYLKLTMQLQNNSENLLSVLLPNAERRNEPDNEDLNVRSDQTMQKVFLCKFCNKQHNSKYSLNKHIDDVHGERVPCDICGKFFTNIRNVKAHIKDIHGQSRLPTTFKCFVCEKQFGRKQKLEKHLKSMASTKSKSQITTKGYNCDFPSCEMSFATSSNVTRYKRVVHGLEK